MRTVGWRDARSEVGAGATARLLSESLIFVLEGHEAPVKRGIQWSQCPHYRDEKIKPSFSPNQALAWASTHRILAEHYAMAMGGSFLLPWPRFPRLSNET